MHNDQITQLRSNPSGASFSGTQVRGGQDNYEFFSAVPADEILDPNAPDQEQCGLTQDRVARFMAVRVVEILEMIQIEHQDAQTLFRPDGPPYLSVEHFLQITTVV